MTTTNTAPPRVVIHGVGQYGAVVAKIALDKGYTIVGALNRAGPKVGQDLGRLIGLDKDIGVIVEDCELADYQALNADIAIDATADRFEDVYPGYERLLGAGINVISLSLFATYPQAADKAVAEKIDALAKAKDVTFTGTSLWEMSRVWMGILATSPCTEISALHHKSVTNMMPIGVHAMKYAGVGCTQDEFKALREKSDVSGTYSLNVQHVLHHIGYQVERVNEYCEPVLFDVPVDCPPLERTIEPGTVAGSRFVSEITTVEGVTANMRVELRLLLPGDTEHTEWTVDGLPGCTIRVDRRDTVHATASTVFNRVPDVIAAEPGIRLFTELGLLKHTALLSKPGNN